MANIHKDRALDAIQKRFGRLHKLSDSQSLFVLGDDAARIYLRCSKLHEGGRTFFGLRDVDLRRLEGHNAFLCFLLDDGSPPLFVPYADFEEVFHNAEAAKDGQYKVQLFTHQDSLELYVARQGRFNVEGYVGLDTLGRAIHSERLREARELTHAQVQTLLAGVGCMKGYGIPSGFADVSRILSEIDVVWIAAGRDSIEGLFEVEHSPSVYSGLLRFNDVLLANPKVSRFAIVSNDTRRALFSRQLHRPTFRRSGLADLTSFLEYANVFDWHSRLSEGDRP